MWIPQLADLSDRFTVIAWDAPGAGQSSDPPAGFAIGDWADTFAAVLDAETISHADVVGLSWAKHRLAACIRGSSLPARDLVTQYLPGMFSDHPPPELRDCLAAIMSDTHPAGFRLMATALSEGDTRDLLPRIKAPTLLIWGDADKRAPMNIAHQLESAILAAELVVLPGVGHVSNLEAPAAFNATLREFLLAHSES